METQKYCSVRVSGPKNQNGGFPQNLPGRFTSVCSVSTVVITQNTTEGHLEGKKTHAMKKGTFFYTYRIQR